MQAWSYLRILSKKKEKESSQQSSIKKRWEIIDKIEYIRGISSETHCQHIPKMEFSDKEFERKDFKMNNKCKGFVSPNSCDCLAPIKLSLLCKYSKISSQDSHDLYVKRLASERICEFTLLQMRFKNKWGPHQHT